jgi:hypothetical protein
MITIEITNDRTAEFKGLDGIMERVVTVWSGTKASPHKMIVLTAFHVVDIEITATEKGRVRLAASKYDSDGFFIDCIWLTGNVISAESF